MNANMKLLIQFLVTTEIVGLLVWLMYALMFSTTNIDPSALEVVKTVVANIIPLASGAVGFWLGTSLSSASKDQTVSRVAELAMFSRPSRPSAPTPEPATPSPSSTTTTPAQGG